MWAHTTSCHIISHFSVLQQNFYGLKFPSYNQSERKVMSDESLEKYMCPHALFSQARSQLVFAHKPRQQKYIFLQAYCISAIRLHCDGTNTISN